jgi:hypothetical protein
MCRGKLTRTRIASYNEKLLLSNGLVISPLKNSATPGQQSRSLKEVIGAVDNNKDFEDYIKSFYSKVPPKSSEPKYERHPVSSTLSDPPFSRAEACLYLLLSPFSYRFLIHNTPSATRWRRCTSNKDHHRHSRNHSNHRNRRKCFHYRRNL